MLRPQPTSDFAQALAERNKAIGQRNEAIAERDFILQFLMDLGSAFSKSRQLSFYPTDHGGVEIRSLYPSPADALAVSSHIADLRAMVAKAYPLRPEPDAALRRYRARVATRQRV